MELTITGSLVALVMLFLLFFNTKWFLNLAVFFVPFSGFACVNLGSAQFAVQVYHIAAPAVILLALVDCYHRRRMAEYLRAPYSLYYLLFACAVISALNATFRSPESANMVLIAQLVHFFVGGLFAVSLGILLASYVSLERVLQVVVASALFIVTWGWFQFLCYRLGFEYPSWVFNNSISPWAAGYGSVVERADMLRVGSVSTEPSFLARFLICVIPLVFTLGKLSPRAKILLVCFLVSGVMISTSTTGYFGFLVMMLLFASYTFRRKPLATLGVFLLILLVISSVFLVFQDLAVATADVTLFKRESSSWTDRLASVEAAFANNASTILLGTGLGDVTSHDTLVKLYSNLGLVGLSVFLVWKSHLFLRCFAVRQGRSGPAEILNPSSQQMILFSFVALLAMDFAAGYSYTYGQYWLIVGLAYHVANQQEPPPFTTLRKPQARRPQ